MTEFLEPRGISQVRLAQATHLSQTRISGVIHGKHRITADAALRLSKALGLSETFWLNIQNDNDIEMEHDRYEAELSDDEVLVSA